MRFSRKIQSRLTSGLLLLSLLAACSEPKAQRANVLLITLDTVRADYLSCYDPSKAHTPNLDSLARAGVRFTRVQSASAVTPVSHATILTGRLPYEHGLRVIAAGGGFQLDREQPSIAAIFKQAGYRTAAIQSAFPVSRTFGLKQGFDVFEDLEGSFSKSSLANTAGWDLDQLQRRSDTTTAMALDFIDSTEEPFFLWIHYWDPHDVQLLPPQEYMEKQPKFSEQGIPIEEDATAMYAIEVEYQDTQLGRLFDGLRQRGLMQDMLIAAIADHGEGLRDGQLQHGWSHHSITYQQQLHVPMILAGPGVPSGIADPRLVSSADLAPTLLELAGLPATQGSGTSLLPLGENQGKGPKRWAYSDQINAFDWNAGLIYWRPKAGFLYAITDGDWKLIYRPHLPFGSSELFHLTLDPQETSNQIEENPIMFRALAENLAARSPWVFQPFEGNGMGEKGREALANIGYSHLEASGDLQWWWECALHSGNRLQTRGRCSSDSKGKPCGFPLLPRTDWTGPAIESTDRK